MCYKRHPVQQTGYLCLSQRSAETPYPLYPSLHQSMLKSKSSNLKLCWKHNYTRSRMFDVAVYLFVRKATLAHFSVKIWSVACTLACLSQAPQRWKWGRGHHLPQDGIPQFHNPPPVEQQVSHYFLWQTQIHKDIPQIHKIALHSSTTHFFLSVLNNRLFIIYSHLQMNVALCDKCKCT